MASLPASTVSGGVRTFAVPEAGRGVVTITRVSDGALIRAFCPVPVVVMPGAPQITSVDPAAAPVGSTVTIRGVNLGDMLHAVYFGAAPITVGETAHTSTLIICVVPAGADSGGVLVQFVTAPQTNRFPFTIGSVQPSGGGTYNKVYATYEPVSWTYGNSWVAAPNNGNKLSATIYYTQVENDPATNTFVIPAGGGVLKAYCDRDPGYGSMRVVGNNKELGTYTDYSASAAPANASEAHYVSPFLPAGTYTVQVYVVHTQFRYGVIDRWEVCTAS
jgi:hypothetical protein